MSAVPHLPPSLYRVFSAFRCELSRFTHENAGVVRAAGLTPQHFSLLVVLAAAGGAGLSIGEAAARLHLAHNSVVGLSQRAEAAGLLTRVSQGGRRQGTLLLLTDHGARRLDELTTVLIDELAEERLALVEALSRWNTLLAAQMVGGPRAAREARQPDRSTLHRAGEDDRPLVWRLLQLYLDELSVPLNAALDETGQYGYPAFERYWERPAHAAYLLREERRPVGFALVRQLRDEPAWHVLDEFGVVRACRGRGLGAGMAAQVLRARPGRWWVAHLPQNLSARQFWEQVLPRHAARPPERREDPARPGVWHFEIEVPAGPALGAD